MTISRRRFMWNAIAAGTVMVKPSSGLLKTASVYGNQIKTDSYFKTRGVVLAVQDLANFNWPQRAKKAGLSTIGTHLHPVEVGAFFKTEKGYKFIQDCSDLGIEIEHELHAMNDLLPRDLYEKNPEMFRMDHNGNRIKNWNLCVHSKEAIEEVCKNAVRYSKLLKSTTGRYFYWIDDARPMCKCSKCRVYSDSEQALILENAIVGALRKHVHPNAKLAHLAYMNSFNPPKQVKPEL